jgi:integrase
MQPIKVVELCWRYWSHCKTYYLKNDEPTHEQAGVKASLRPVKELYGESLVTEFGPLALEVVRDRMVARGNSRKYINQNVGRIRRMFRWGVSKQLVPVEIYQALTALVGLKKGRCNARETGPVLPIDDAIVDQTIPHLTNSTTADMIRFQRLTSCRPGELFVMRPRDVDRTGGGYEGVWLYFPESHKMEHRDRHRVIVIGPKAQRMLAKYLLRDADEFCFLRKDGKPYKRTHYAQHIYRACDKAFPPDEKLEGEALKQWQKSQRWAPNRLRHTASTEIRKAYGLEAAQVVDGHASLDVTQIYAERDLAKAVKIIAEVG